MSVLSHRFYAIQPKKGGWLEGGSIPKQRDEPGNLSLGPCLVDLPHTAPNTNKEPSSKRKGIYGVVSEGVCFLPKTQGALAPSFTHSPVSISSISSIVILTTYINHQFYDISNILHHIYIQQTPNHPTNPPSASQCHMCDAPTWLQSAWSPHRITTKCKIINSIQQL